MNETKTIIDHLGLKPIHSFQQLLKLTDFVSGNDLYRAKTTHNSNKAWIYKNPRATALQEEIMWNIKNLPDSIKNSVKAYTMQLGFLRNTKGWVMKNGRLKRIDLTNLLKVIEDGISPALGVDDCLCVDSRSIKLINESLTDDSFPINVSIVFYG